MSKTQAQHQRDQYQKQQERINKLREERDAARSEVERLRAWVVSVREIAYHQTYPGSRYVCRFCGGLEHREHNPSCIMTDESKEGGA